MPLELHAAAFDAIRKIVYRAAGIQLGDAKHALVASRLTKRLTRLGYEDFDSYVEVINHRDPSGAELRELINCLTTNKTDFFRESHHFEFLAERFIAEAKARVAKGAPRRIRIWSAGCSTGEEPWTIAMVVADALRGLPGWDVKILASDIDTKVLATAAEGVYSHERLEPIPAKLRDTAFAEVSGSYRVRDELRELVAFRRINFMDDPWPVRTKFDGIFCRNVTIYFDRPTQDRFYRRLVKYIAPQGYLFAGHSENLSWLGDVLAPIGATIYVPTSGGFRGRRSMPPAADRTSTAPSVGSSAPVAVSAPPRALATPMPQAFVPERKKISVQSGGVYATSEDVRLRTVLGTCVTACLWDEDAQVGGMNHFMLPDGDDPSAPARFGVHAMELLINELMRQGADRRKLKAKAFGAARVLRSSLGANVANRNEAFVRQFLATEGIPLVVGRFGGDSAMEVEFEVRTGRAFVRQVARDLISAAEDKYRRALRARKDASDAELF